jgi:hypothetical protein
MSDSPTTSSGRRPSSNSVTSMPLSASSDASVAPAGPLPMIPTVLIGVLIMIKTLVYDWQRMRNIRFFPAGKSILTGIKSPPAGAPGARSPRTKTFRHTPGRCPALETARIAARIAA